jgi:hypothetical protein
MILVFVQLLLENVSLISKKIPVFSFAQNWSPKNKKAEPDFIRVPL